MSAPIFVDSTVFTRLLLGGPGSDFAVNFFSRVESGVDYAVTDSLALLEALSNAVRHGCGENSERMVEVCVACEESRGVLIVVRDPGGGFDPGELEAHPERYRSIMDRWLPHLTLLFNAVYWEPGQPRLVTREHLRALVAGGQPRLRVIADITCDVNGSIEATVRATDPGNPVFTYDPLTGEALQVRRLVEAAARALDGGVHGHRQPVPPLVVRKQQDEVGLTPGGCRHGRTQGAARQPGGPRTQAVEAPAAREAPEVKVCHGGLLGAASADRCPFAFRRE